MNLLFLDKIEKWGCGVLPDDDRTTYVYNAGLEIDLKAQESCCVGSLYLTPCIPAEDGNPYLQIRIWWPPLATPPPPRAFTTA